MKLIQADKKRSPLGLIGDAADLSDLPLPASKRLDITHPDHRSRKVGHELRRVPSVLRHDAVRRAAIEESLIRWQEPLLLHQDLEVVVVEPAGGHQIQRRRAQARPTQRTIALEGAREPGINVGPVAVDSITVRDAKS